MGLVLSMVFVSLSVKRQWCSGRKFLEYSQSLLAFTQHAGMAQKTLMEKAEEKHLGFRLQLSLPGWHCYANA